MHTTNSGSCVHTVSILLMMERVSANMAGLVGMVWATGSVVIPPIIVAD